MYVWVSIALIFERNGIPISYGSSLYVWLSMVNGVQAPFYYAIDHCFPIKGHGTVLTGTVLSGSVSTNSVIEIPELQVDSTLYIHTYIHKYIDTFLLLVLYYMHTIRTYIHM